MGPAHSVIQGNGPSPIWLYDEPQRTIDFAFSNENNPTRTSYKVGEGMIGKSFEENRAFNDADVRTLPSYLNTRTSEPPYRAVLCFPVNFGSARVGMLTVDKRDATLFSAMAVDIARGLAAQCALAAEIYSRY